MNEFTAWMQSNWYELGKPFTDFVFLAVGIWFARKILRTLRASQEQVGTLIKLTVAGTVPRAAIRKYRAERSFATGSPYWLTPSETPSANQPALLSESRLSAAGHGIVAWLNTPMKSGSAAPWRKAIRLAAVSPPEADRSGRLKSRVPEGCAARREALCISAGRAVFEILWTAQYK